jgi:hypothetical protein
VTAMEATPLHRYVDAWTPPQELRRGDRARTGGLDVEWDGRHPIPVCLEDDVAMTEWTDLGVRCCPMCGATEQQLRESL